MGKGTELEFPEGRGGGRGQGAATQSGGSPCWIKSPIKNIVKQ